MGALFSGKYVLDLLCEKCNILYTIKEKRNFFVPSVGYVVGYNNHTDKCKLCKSNLKIESIKCILENPLVIETEKCKKFESVCKSCGSVYHKEIKFYKYHEAIAIKKKLQLELYKDGCVSCGSKNITILKICSE